MRSITTPEAPAAIGTYSQAVRAGDTVYVSGQIPLDPKTAKLVEGDFEVHVRRVFDNLRAICKEAGGDFDRVARVAGKKVTWRRPGRPAPRRPRLPPVQGAPRTCRGT